MISSNDCPICFSRFDNTQHFPMIVGKCGHTICKICAGSLTVCPTCRQPIEPTHMIKNYVMIDKTLGRASSIGGDKSVDVKLADVALNEDRDRSEIQIECPNGHGCLWRGETYKCAKCHKLDSYGWHCIVCKYLHCDSCKKTILTGKSCPNGHKTTWQGQINLKTRPYKLTRPEYTRQHNYYMHRKACANQKNQYSDATHSSGHPLVYSSDEYRKPAIGGWVCNDCLFIMCKFCQPIDYRRQICPNGHKTTWFGQDKSCAKCDEQSGGWRCQRCKYYLCDKCSDNLDHPVIKEQVKIRKNTTTNCCQLF